MSTAEILEVSGLSASYGRVQVVNDVGFTVGPGEMVAMVGRNGAGKTTSLSAISGLRYGHGGGTVRVGSVDVSHASPSAVVLAGMKLVPEGRRIFREMTVYENLRLGAFLRRRKGRDDIDEDLRRVFELFPVLERDQKKDVSQLSGGQQQMVAVGQALMSRPRFLLLDEPSAGLAPTLIDEMYDRFTALAQEGIGVLIVDQNIERVLESTSRFYVVDDGHVVLDGRCSDPGVLESVTRVVLGSDSQREAALGH
jgi:branched-chain amino acid transport system ATP-binding protein